MRCLWSGFEQSLAPKLVRGWIRDARRCRFHALIKCTRLRITRASRARPLVDCEGGAARPGWTGERAGALRAHLLVGCDPTQGIVAVEADTRGQARIWQRVDGRLVAASHSFPNWFLVTSLELLAHLPSTSRPPCSAQPTAPLPRPLR